MFDCYSRNTCARVFSLYGVLLSYECSSSTENLAWRRFLRCMSTRYQPVVSIQRVVATALTAYIVPAASKTHSDCCSDIYAHYGSFVGLNNVLGSYDRYRPTIYLAAIYLQLCAVLSRATFQDRLS